MAINFPNTPAVNQEYTVENTTWIWTGQTWDVKSASPPTVSQDTFRVISIAGQSSVIAEQPNDTLTLIAGSGISLTTNNASDSITISSTTSSGSSNLSNLSDVQLSNLLTGQVLKYNGTLWTNSVDLTGEGGGGSATFEVVNTSVDEKTLRLTASGVEYDVGISAGNNVSLGLAGNVITINSELPALTQAATTLTAGKVKVSLKEGTTELSQFTLKPGNNITFQIVNGEIQISASSTNSGIFASPVVINNITASTSATTGSLIVGGGAGIAGDLNVGGDVYSSAEVTSDNQLTNKKYVDSLGLAYSVVFGL